jgi:tetratricopeptide (TPR) repeat protein
MRQRNQCKQQADTPSPPLPRPRRRWAAIALGALTIAMLIVIATELISVYVGRRYEIVARGDAHTAPEISRLIRETNQALVGVVRRYPRDPQALDAMARLHYRFGATEDAYYWWQRCLEADPDFAPAYHSLGKLAYDAGQAVEAEQLYRQAMRCDAVSSVFPVQLAESLMHQGKNPEAIAVLADNVKRHPSSMPSHVLLGQLYVQEGEYAPAREHLERAVTMAPDFTNAYYTLATACARLGDMEKSREYIERFKQLKALDEQAHRDMLKTDDDLAEVHQSAASLYSAAAQVHIAHGDVRTGEQYLLRALELAPASPQANEVLAWLYQRQGRMEAAVLLLATLEDIASEELASQMTVANLYVEMGYLDKAERVYRRMIQLAPHQAANYALLADLLLSTGKQLDDARQLASKAVSLDRRATYYALLSAACLHSGDPAAAFEAINQALHLEPGNSEYRALRTSIRAQHTGH